MLVTFADSPSPFPVLRRAGIVLIIAGIIDLAILLYCVVYGIPYASSLNVFAITAGLFLLRGSLKMANLVRVSSIFALAASAATLAAIPFVVPFDLAMTAARLYPGACLATSGSTVFFIALSAWLVQQLGADSIRSARIERGFKNKSLWVPGAVGLLVVIILFSAIKFVTTSDIAIHAVHIAKQSSGAGYRYFLESLSVDTKRGTLTFSGVVVAWNEKEIKKIPVVWNE